uniref:Uncharacterized protein n=1 Tax=Arundo donax TaxID=35708 RepID=A0A0A9SFM2_ARUDO
MRPPSGVCVCVRARACVLVLHKVLSQPIN